MILTDLSIRCALAEGKILIDPTPSADCMQPCSVDLRLGATFLRYTSRWEQTRPRHDQTPLMESVTVEVGDPYLLPPHGFVLAQTMESITITAHAGLVGQIIGKSSVARCGVFPVVGAGFFETGWSGVPTLELYNASGNTIELWPGDKICHFQFWETSGTPDRSYGDAGLGSRYQHSLGVTAAKAERDGT